MGSGRYLEGDGSVVAGEEWKGGWGEGIPRFRPSVGVSGAEKICFQPPVARLGLSEKFSRGMESICFLCRTKPRGVGFGVPMEPIVNRLGRVVEVYVGCERVSRCWMRFMVLVGGGADM